ncbi:glycosyltransferase family 4 protein [bacterium]|nr:glycosyltransferase family 4 protein [bacterium]
MKMREVKSIPVVFMTSVFGEVHNGPALYAGYLWACFKDDPGIEFHLVTTVSRVKHERIHEIGHASGSVELYKRLQLRAMKVAGDIGEECVIIHGNNAHSMTLLKDYHGPVIGQVNDYDAARVLRFSLGLIFRQGIRRFFSLLYRHRNEQSFFNFANTVVCNSEFVHGELNFRYLIPEDLPMVVIHKAVDFRSFFRVENGSPRSGDLLFIGSNWIGKGLDIAIRALARMPPEYCQLRLGVAGEGSSGKAKIRRLVKKYHLEDRVVFYGNVAREALPQLICSSSILLFPSRNEALGVAVIEAVASCRPVIASNVGGIPEVLAGTRCSRLVSNHSSEYAQCIEALLSCYPTQEMLVRDREFVKEKFNRDVMIEKIRNIYTEVAVNHERQT